MNSDEAIAGKKLIKTLNEETLVFKNKNTVEIYFPKSRKTIKFPVGSEFMDAFFHRGKWVITSEHKNGLFGVDLIGEFKRVNLLKNLAQKPTIEVKDMMSLYVSAAYSYCDDLGYQTRKISFIEGDKRKTMSVSKLIRYRVEHKR